MFFIVLSFSSVLLLLALMFRYFYRLLPSCDITIVDSFCGVKEIKKLTHLSCTIAYMLDGNTRYKSVHIVEKQNKGSVLLAAKDELMRLNGATICYYHIPFLKRIGYIDNEYLLPDIRIYIVVLIAVLIPLVSVILSNYYL